MDLQRLQVFKEMGEVSNSYVYQYRGEGNAHLALSLPQAKTILLIKKLEPGHKSDPVSWDNSIDFYNNIMAMLLQPFVLPVTKVYLQNCEVQQIESSIAYVRPDLASMASDLFKEEKKIKIRIEKAAKRLKCMEDIKERIGKLIDKYVTETGEIEDRILCTEKLIETLLGAQTQAAGTRKLREEIHEIKMEKKAAEAELMKLKKELCCKMKKLEKAQKKAPKVPENACGGGD